MQKNERFDKNKNSIMSWTPNFEDAFRTTNMEKQQHQSENNSADGSTSTQDILEQLAELDGRTPSDPFVSVIQITFDDTDDDDGSNDSNPATGGGEGGGEGQRRHRQQHEEEEEEEEEEKPKTKHEQQKKKKSFHLLSKLKQAHKRMKLLEQEKRQQQELQKQQKQLLLQKQKQIQKEKKKAKKQPPPSKTKNTKKIQSVSKGEVLKKQEETSKPPVSKGGDSNNLVVKKKEESKSPRPKQQQKPAAGRTCVVTVTTTDAAGLKEAQPVEQRSPSSATAGTVATATDVSLSSGDGHGGGGNEDAEMVPTGQHQQSDDEHDVPNLEDNGVTGHGGRQQDATCTVTFSTNSKFLASVFSFRNDDDDICNAGTFDEDGDDVYDDLSTLDSTLLTSKTMEKEDTKTIEICGTANSSSPMAKKTNGGPARAVSKSTGNKVVEEEDQVEKDGNHFAPLIQLMSHMRTTTVPRSNGRQRIQRKDSRDFMDKDDGDGGDDDDDGILLDDITAEPKSTESKKTIRSSPSDLWDYLMRKDLEYCSPQEVTEQEQVDPTLCPCSCAGKQEGKAEPDNDCVSGSNVCGELLSGDDDDDETLGSLSLVPLTKNQHLGSLVRDTSAVEVILNKNSAVGRFQQHMRYRSELAKAQTKGSNMSTALVFADFKPDKKKASRKLPIPLIRGLGSSFARKSVSSKGGVCPSKLNEGDEAFKNEGITMEKPIDVLDECTIHLQPHHGHPSSDDVDARTAASGSTKSETITIVTDVSEEEFDTNGTRLHCWNVTCHSTNVKDRRNCIISIGSVPHDARNEGCTPCLMFGEEGQQQDFFEKTESKPVSFEDNQSTVKGCCVASEPTPCLVYGEGEQQQDFFEENASKPGSVGENHGNVKGCTISVPDVPQEARNDLCSPCLMLAEEDQQELPAFVGADEVGTITDASFDETLTTLDDTRTNPTFRSHRHNSSRQKAESSSCPTLSCWGQSDEHKFECADEFDYDYKRYANCAHYDDDDTYGSLRDEFPAAFPTRRRSEFEFPNYHPDEFERLMKCRNSCRPTSPTDWVY